MMEVIVVSVFVNTTPFFAAPEKVSSTCLGSRLIISMHIMFHMLINVDKYGLSQRVLRPEMISESTSPRTSIL
jgi:hypothetical protein